MITLKNISKSVIFHKGEMILPEKEFEVEELYEWVKRYVADGFLEVNDSRKETAEVAKEILSKKRKTKELKEDGGEV